MAADGVPGVFRANENLTAAPTGHRPTTGAQSPGRATLTRRYSNHAAISFVKLPSSVCMCSH
jgi:hypothetical protein